MRVEKLLQRLKREFIKVNLLQACLDTLIVFLTANIILFTFSLRATGLMSNLHFVLLVSAGTFITSMAYRTKNYRLEIYEEKNPELKERLRTARDNLNRQNIVSQALFDEVMDRSRSVTSESIIPSRSIMQKIVAVGILSFLTVFSGMTNFQVIEDGGQLLPQLDELKKIVDGEKKEDGFELKNSSKIFGEPQKIDSSNSDISFNITGSGKSEESELGAEKRNRPVVLDATGLSLGEDAELARKYSLAIKEFS